MKSNFFPSFIDFNTRNALVDVCYSTRIALNLQIHSEKFIRTQEDGRFDKRYWHFG
ncbi:MAG: hypothetical protein ACI81T_002717, partial [Bacteroidia bacterium]